MIAQVVNSQSWQWHAALALSSQQHSMVGFGCKPEPVVQLTALMLPFSSRLAKKQRLTLNRVFKL